jgi:hypothetical protein
VLYNLGKIFSQAIRFALAFIKKNLIWERYECPKFWDPLGSSGEN